MVKSCSFIAIIAVCCSMSALLVGASPAQVEGQIPKIKARTELVLVAVIAHRGGNHVAGLKTEDFTLQSDGKAQSIAVFEEVHPGAPTKQVTSGEFSNIAESRSAPEQLTIIAIDMNTTAPLDQAYLKDEIVKFLDSATNTGEPFALVAITRSGIRVLHDFTTDPKLLAAVVKGQPLQVSAKEAPGGTVMDFRPQLADNGVKLLEVWTALMTNQEPFEIFRDWSSSVNTLVALQQLAQSLRGLPGRRRWYGPARELCCLAE